ncbi:DUF523 domain-containing protein [Denitrobacterium detoxificans]|uniref:DUF523 domain-containing protein n=1 Tax=Denitrobacterium detoxificans TaxID=79604 RepID=UPI0026EAAF31|nr:DUF523 domain-containing protein [Denitrobacterium detoxificans]
MMSNDLPPILVSACLMGEPCRYDGKDYPCPAAQNLADTRTLIPICPEVMAGLPTPRTCAELQPDGRVIDADGVDRTAAFEAGAHEAVRIAREHDCKQAILKSKSPSCGKGLVYDGTFSGTLVPGMGKTAQALIDAGIEVLSENDCADLQS